MYKMYKMYKIGLDWNTGCSWKWPQEDVLICFDRLDKLAAVLVKHACYGRY